MKPRLDVATVVFDSSASGFRVPC